MFELEQVGKNTYYITNPAKMGLYTCHDGGVYLFDSGIDKDAGRRIRQILDAKGWHLKAIINTHSNADHIGGNPYLQGHYNCPVFANGMEAAFTRYPIVEPSFLYGGYPFKELRHKFLLAPGSQANDFSHPDFPDIFEVIPLPGHFFDMVGFRTPDDVVFLADSLCSETTLEKYAITFIYDVAAYLETLKTLETLKAAVFVPAHANAAADISTLARLNAAKVLEIADAIKTQCETPQSFEDVLKAICDRYQIKLNFEQYVLVGSTIRSYLAWMKDSGEMDVIFEDNRMFWKRVSCLGV